MSEGRSRVRERPSAASGSLIPRCFRGRGRGLLTLLAGFLLPRAQRYVRAGRAERGALCTFHAHVRWFCLHLPRP